MVEKKKKGNVGIGKKNGENLEWKVEKKIDRKGKKKGQEKVRKRMGKVSNRNVKGKEQEWEK